MADTNEAGVSQLRSHLVLESPEPADVVARIVRAAKRGCFAEQLVQTAVPMASTFELNGQPIDVAPR